MQAARSETRQLYPHSLSYQASTLTMLPPIPMVSSASTIELAVLPLKSDDTSGSSMTSRIPRSEPPEAQRRAELTDSAVDGLSVSTTRSMIETVEVGTRREVPLSFPLSSGSTSESA